MHARSVKKNATVLKKSDGERKLRTRNNSQGCQQARLLIFGAAFLLLSLLLLLLRNNTTASSSGLIHEFDADVASTSTSATENNDGSSTKRTSTVKVFMGIKTKEVGIHGIRLPQIRRTWLKDALDAGINIKFFGDSESVTSVSSIRGGDTPQSQEVNTNIAGAGSPSNNDIDMQPLTVLLDRCSGIDISCKTAAMFAYFLEQDTTSDFFCNFDDDNYVLVPNLIRVLESYHERGGDIYVGRKFWKLGFSIGKGWGAGYENITVHHLTGGAGYCLSRQLVERGRDLFTSPPPRLPDDIAVGYIVQEKLGVKTIQDDLFHSHYESSLQQKLPQQDIAKQVSFGFNNKHKRAFARTSMPDFPILFSPDDDPLLFRSLRCFLLAQQDSVATASNEACPSTSS